MLASLFVPGALYAYWLATHQLGGRQVMELIHGIGLWAIRLMLISLAITPFARALDWNGLLLVRRNVGVAAALYAVAHLALYVVDQNFRLGTVVSEIALRFYLTIGFIVAAGADRAWPGPPRTAGPSGSGGTGSGCTGWLIRSARWPCFTTTSRSKLNVSEPVFVSGLFVWLMAWRLLPEAWRRRQSFGLLAALYGGLAMISAALTAGLELAWYGLATRVDPFRVLAANETIARGLRPAHWVLVVALALAVIILARRLTRLQAPVRRAVA